MFWHHSSDPKTLALDEQFLFGSHALVAPVLAFGDRKKRVYLPSGVDGSKDKPEWCELDTGRWHTSSSDGHFINMGKSEEYPKCVNILTFYFILLCRRVSVSYSRSCSRWRDPCAL